MSMMDDEDEVTYRSNGPVKNDSYPRDVGNSDDDNDDEEEEEDENEKAINDGQDEDEDNDDDDDGGNGVQRIGKDDYEYGDEDDNNEDDDNGDQQRHPKKRKLKNLISSYEFAPRVPPAPSPAAPKPSYGGRNPLTDWTERESMVLLDAWGDRFLKHGRKSLRSEEWQEVAEKVSRESRIERTDTQCRNRLDTLKKKYKKEKMKKLGDAASEWVYFKNIDALLSPQVQQTGLSCGVDSGEYVFMNPKVYLDRSNGLDEMMDSPGNSTDGEEDESDGLPPKKTKSEKTKGSTGSFKMLADSFQKFSKIYERIETSKREQMVELEKMRMEFHRDLELQKREIIERAQAEIAKIRMGEDEAENISG